MGLYADLSNRTEEIAETPEILQARARDKAREAGRKLARGAAVVGGAVLVALVARKAVLK